MLDRGSPCDLFISGGRMLCLISNIIIFLLHFTCLMKELRCNNHRHLAMTLCSSLLRAWIIGATRQVRSLWKYGATLLSLRAPNCFCVWNEEVAFIYKSRVCAEVSIFRPSGVRAQLFLQEWFLETYLWFIMFPVFWTHDYLIIQSLSRFSIILLFASPSPASAKVRSFSCEAVTTAVQSDNRSRWRRPL